MKPGGHRHSGSSTVHTRSEGCSTLQPAFFRSLLLPPPSRGRKQEARLLVTMSGLKNPYMEESLKLTPFSVIHDRLFSPTFFCTSTFQSTFIVNLSGIFSSVQARCVLGPPCQEFGIRSGSIGLNCFFYIFFGGIFLFFFLLLLTELHMNSCSFAPLQHREDILL